MDIQYQTATNLSFKHVIEKIESFTFPPVRKKVASRKLREPITGVWATSNNKLLGAILAAQKRDKTSELFSFFVAPDYRNEGIGKELLARLEGSLQSQGFKWVQSSYRSDWTSIDIIEHLLNRNKWEQPDLRFVMAKIEIKQYPVVPWPKIKLPAHYDLLSWDTLSAAEINQIKTLTTSKEFPIEMDPFQHPEKMHVAISTGLRHKDQIIGWNISYQQNEETIEYNNLFIQKDFQRLGHAIALLHRSFGEQYKLNIPYCTWAVDYNNKPVLKMMEKIASDFLLKKVDVIVSRKRLY